MRKSGEGKLFAIKSPSGFLLGYTTSRSKAEAWKRAYFSDLWKFFRHVVAPTKAAYRRGWRCVLVKVLEEQHHDCPSRQMLF